MVATITPAFKKQIIQTLFNDVADSAERYYIAIGKSEDWDSADTAPTPSATLREERNARLGFQSLKSAEDVSFVVPRTNWATGTIYNAWDDNYATYPSPNYYVITGANAVYICLAQGRDATGTVVPSTVEPTSTAVVPSTLSDGYRWKFLYTITAANASNFLTANYIPVRKVTTDSSSPALDLEQAAIQNAAIAGQVSGVKIITTGSGYSSAPTVSIIGNGTGAEATATVSAGGVVKIEMNNDSAALGSGYTYAQAVLTGGGFSTAATVRAILGPKNGFGADPRDDLRSTALMFNTKPSGTEGGNFIVGNDFRQVALIKDPLKSNDSNFIGASGNMLRTLSFATVGTAFSADKIILGGTSGAQAYVDNFDSDILYFHQTEETGFTSFIEGEAISETNGSGTGTLDAGGVDADSNADTAGAVNAFSGEVLYIDNRASIDRSADQTEDIKVIIQV